jgi:hypothetical protein
MKISKKKLLIGIPLALISLEIFFGIIFGYLAGKFIAGKKAGYQGRIRSLAFNIGNYRVHFHHWMYCLGILASFAHFQFFPLSPLFSFGFFGGAIIQGFTYPDWHSVLKRLR